MYIIVQEKRNLINSGYWYSIESVLDHVSEDTEGDHAAKTCHTCSNIGSILHASIPYELSESPQIAWILHDQIRLTKQM